MAEAVTECLQSVKKKFPSDVDDSSEGHIRKKAARPSIPLGSKNLSGQDRLAPKFSELVGPCNKHLILRFAAGLRFEEWEQPAPLAPPEITYEDDQAIEFDCWRRPLVTRAAENGHLPILQRLKTKQLHGWPAEAMFSAVRGGHLAVVEWLHANHFQHNEEWTFSLTKANIHVGEWLLVNGQRSCTKWSASEAVEHGHLPVLEWLHGHDLDWHFSGHSMNLAEQNGHLSVVKFLHSMQDKQINQQCFPFLGMRVDMLNVHLPVVEWLHKNYSEEEWLHKSYSETSYSGIKSAVASAAWDGNLTLAKWLHSKHVKTNSMAMDMAAANGKLLVIEWLHANRTEGCTVRALDRAAYHGHLSVVEWLHANRTEGCTVYAMDRAAEYGHLSVMEWLHANRSEGCTTDAMDGAAVAGHLHIVEWLHAHRTEGCTTQAMDFAAEEGHLHVVEWLHVNRSEGCTTLAMDRAAPRGHLHVVEWLNANRSEGCTRNAMDWAAANNHVPVVKWLLANRSEGCTSEAIDKAAARGLLAVMELLHAECSSAHWTSKALEGAARSGYLSVLEWLCANQHSGPIDVHKWMDVTSEEGNCIILKIAIRHGHLPVVHWFFSKNIARLWTL